MILSVLSASDPSSDPTTFKDAQEQATNAASWVEQNWSTWLGIGLRILLIVVVAASSEWPSGAPSPSSSSA